MRHPKMNSILFAQWRRVVSFALAVLLFATAAPFPALSVESGETGETPLVNESELQENVQQGNQAIFDWWSEFLLVSDPTVEGVYDVGTNWYSYDFLGADGLVVTLVDYYYDEENGYVWYKVGGDDLPAMLRACPWVLYCVDTDIEQGFDPYLAIYDADAAIRFVDAAYLAGDGTQVSATFVLSGPAALTDAEISITHNTTLEYSTSAMSYYDADTGEGWYRGFDIAVTLGESAWTADNGAIDIRYVATTFGSDTYSQSLYYGGAFVLEDAVAVSGTATDLTGLDASDLVTTAAGNCTLVFELLCESYTEMDAQGYFSGEYVPLYLASADECVDYIAPAPPTTVSVVGAFTANDADWYWISCDETPERGYFLVPVEYITFVDVENIYWYLMETVSKDGYAETEDEFAEELSEFTFSAAQQESLQEHLASIPYRADMVYTPWSGRIGPLMPPVTVSTPAVYSRMSRAAMFANSGIATVAEAEDTNNNGLELSKKVVENDNGTYTITIEAYTTGKVTVVTKKTAVDVILVLDMSSSMKESFGSTTRFTAVQNAAATFTNEIIKAAKGVDGEFNTDDDIDHRVSIVSYNKEVLVKCGLVNVSDENSASKVTTAVDALETSQGTRSDFGLDAAVAVFQASDGTKTTYEDPDGNSSTFKNDSVTSTSRQRVVLFFTDGYPSTSGSTNFTGSYAEDAINNAYKLKNDLGATVYSVAVLDKADPTTTPSWSGTCGTGVDISLVNGYLHAISSNYPNAKAEYSETSTASEENAGDSARAPSRPDEDGGSSSSSGKLIIYDDTSSSSSPTNTGFNANDYYLTASSTDELNGIFDTVSNVVVSGGSNINLGTQTTIKDIITPQFVLPPNAGQVTVKQVDYQGDGKWDTENAVTLKSESVVTIDETTSSVNVTGFDFNHNFVAETGRTEGDTTKEGTFKGRKLVIEFNITSDQDFLGGSNVPTNGETSGLYNDDGEPIEYLPQPSYDFDLKPIDTVVQDRHIYLGNTVDLVSVLDLVVDVIDTTGGKLQMRADGINNLYVDLVYTVTLPGGTKLTYTIPAGTEWDKGTWTNADGNVQDWSKLEISNDTKYSITCVMTDINDRSKIVTAKGTATIYVYKPTVTFKDTTHKYQESLGSYSSVTEFLDDHHVGTTWANGGYTITSQNIYWCSACGKDVNSVQITDGICCCTECGQEVQEVFLKNGSRILMEGVEPAINFTYGLKDEDKDAFENLIMNADQDVSVDVTAQIKGNWEPKYSMVFEHASCNHTTWGDEEFIVHVLHDTTSLTIQKTLINIGPDVIEGGKTFTFLVTLPDGKTKNDCPDVPAGDWVSDTQFKVTVTIKDDVPVKDTNNPGANQKSNSVTISNLPLGVYTIEEVDIAPGYACYWGDVKTTKTTIDLSNTSHGTAYCSNQFPVYEVYYEADTGGSVNVNKGYYNANEDAFDPSTATPEDGYKFVGWYDENGNKVSDDLTFKPGFAYAGQTLTAKFTKNETSLTITKAGMQDGDYSLFHITGNGVDLIISIRGNGSVTIDGLIIGETYIVTELTDWTWKYSNPPSWKYGGTSGTGMEASIVLVENGQITFNNTYEKPDWLGGEAGCDNEFKS